MGSCPLCIWVLSLSNYRISMNIALERSGLFLQFVYAAVFSSLRHTNTCMNTGGVSFLLCVYLGQTRRGGEEEQRAERRGLPVEERLLRRTALTIVKGDQTAEEKIQWRYFRNTEKYRNTEKKQTVANTSKKRDILDIDNDNLQHTKLLWGLTTSKLLNIFKNWNMLSRWQCKVH